MRIVIFGASGKTGTELIKLGLARGHSITAFVRDPSKLVYAQSVRIVQGDVTQPAPVREAVIGQDAVLCVLGQKSPFKRDPELVRGMKHVLEAMRDAEVERLVYLSFAGVRGGRRHAGWVLNLLMVPLLHAIVADHEAREALIRESGCHWTMIRAVMLTKGPHTGTFRYGEGIRPRSILPAIARADVADLMLQVLHERGAIGKAFQIMY